jgi:hypothetical protein
MSIAHKLASAVAGVVMLFPLPALADTIIVEGTIAPWLWNGSGFYQGPLIDPGIFAPPGTSLTGLPITILWTTQSSNVTAGDLSPADPTFSAAITINGTTVVLGGNSYTNFGSPIRTQSCRRTIRTSRSPTSTRSTTSPATSPSIASIFRCSLWYTGFCSHWLHVGNTYQKPLSKRLTVIGCRGWPWLQRIAPQVVAIQLDQVESV